MGNSGDRKRPTHVRHDNSNSVILSSIHLIFVEKRRVKIEFTGPLSVVNRPMLYLYITSLLFVNFVYAKRTFYRIINLVALVPKFGEKQFVYFVLRPR